MTPFFKQTWLFTGLLCLTLGSPGFAGNISSGGGNAFVMRSILGKVKEVYLVDTFDILHRQNSLRFFSSDRRKMRAFLLELARQRSPRLYPRVLEKLSETHPKRLRWDYVPGPLPKLTDDIESRCGWNCRREQLAIQDLRTSRVQVDQTLFSRLSDLEKELLILHEAYIALIPSSENTRVVRDIVKALIAKKEIFGLLMRSGSRVDALQTLFAVSLVDYFGDIPGHLGSVEAFTGQLKNIDWNVFEKFTYGTDSQMKWFVLVRLAQKFALRMRDAKICGTTKDYAYEDSEKFAAASAAVHQWFATMPASVSLEIVAWGAGAKYCLNVSRHPD